MELTNEQRTYLGLELIEPAWDRVEIPNSLKPEQATGKEILYFDGDTIRKIISKGDNGRYLEYSACLKTQENRTMIAPRTAKGKARRLNACNLQRCHFGGMYFCYDRGHVILANETTQQTYFSSRFAGLPPMSGEELERFLEQWMADTDQEELERIHAFARAKRKHCRFQEGDFFRFRIDRTHYGYGRILMDVMKWKKSGEKFWDILMGRPLVVSVYHTVTENPLMDVRELALLKSCPSQFIMDNRFYYGEYEVIGHAPLPETVDYPIMYGPSISALDRDKIIFQWGRIYQEIPWHGNTVVPGDFRNNGIGCSLDVDKNVLEACIKEDSNEPYWNRPGTYGRDLRNPKYADELAQVLAQMGVGQKDWKPEQKTIEDD